MRADLALIGFILTLAGGRTLLVRRRRRGGVPLRLLGPAPMSVAMVKRQYRYKLTLKCRGDKAFRAMLRAALAQYDAGGWASKASVTIDFHSDADL